MEGSVFIQPTRTCLTPSTKTSTVFTVLLLFHDISSLFISSVFYYLFSSIPFCSYLYYLPFYSFLITTNYQSCNYCTIPCHLCIHLNSWYIHCMPYSCFMSQPVPKSNLITLYPTTYPTLSYPWPSYKIYLDPDHITWTFLVE